MSCIKVKIKCGDFGEQYRSKSWNFNSKYKRKIWKCNRKYVGEEKYHSSNLTDEQVQEIIVQAVNLLVEINEYFDWSETSNEE